MQNSGLGGQFSDADLKLAQQNPDAGMSIPKYKRDYHNATTPEQRALANLGAEGIRSSYGNYTGAERVHSSTLTHFPRTASSRMQSRRTLRAARGWWMIF